jgi:hypothetical protein
MKMSVRLSYQYPRFATTSFVAEMFSRARRSCAQQWPLPRIAASSRTSDATASRPQVNGILETSLTSSTRPDRSSSIAAFFGFEPIDTDQKEGITDQTCLCALRAGDRSVLLLFKKGATADTNATGAIHVAFGISRSELPLWEAWLLHQGIAIELRKTWKYGGEALYFRNPDGHLLEVVTPGVWSIF